MGVNWRIVRGLMFRSGRFSVRSQAVGKRLDFSEGRLQVFGEFGG